VERSKRHQLSRSTRLHSRRAEGPAGMGGRMRCPLGGKWAETTRGHGQARCRGRAIIARKACKEEHAGGQPSQRKGARGSPGGRQDPSDGSGGSRKRREK
jgi:hypothetical protein